MKSFSFKFLSIIFPIPPIIENIQSYNRINSKIEDY
jgi:hypothetical protein